MVEALAAILIAALGATLLATMVMTSVNVSSTSQRVLETSYDDESALLSSEGHNETISVDVAGSSAAVDVKLFGSGSYEYYEDVS